MKNGNTDKYTDEYVSSMIVLYRGKQKKRMTQDRKKKWQFTWLRHTG